MYLVAGCAIVSADCGDFSVCVIIILSCPSHNLTLVMPVQVSQTCQSDVGSHSASQTDIAQADTSI
eukprot:3492370-Rhodomonas_salina.1